MRRRLNATMLVLAGGLVSGCIGDSGGSDVEALQLTAVQDDAHCRSLKLQVGSLVYVQCRLALQKTYLKDYEERKAQYREILGPTTERLDQALRNDTFCHYDESVKAAVDGVGPDEAAQTAYELCSDSREELITAVNRDYGGDGQALTARERQAMIERDIDAYREANAVMSSI